MRAVLTYHSLDESGSPISVTPEAFRQHVTWLASGAVQVMPLTELVALDSDEGPASADAVALTFDDGFSNFARHGQPLLSEHGLPATLFVVSDHVGGDNQWGGVRHPAVPVLPLLDWDALAAMTGSGIELGAHTRRHPHLSRLTGAAVEDEMLGAIDSIASHTGQRPGSFAYPYGDCNDAVAQVARRTFSCSCTTDFRILGDREDPARIPRLDAWYFQKPGKLESWGTTAFRLEVQLRAGARKARRLLRAD